MSRFTGLFVVLVSIPACGFVETEYGAQPSPPNVPTEVGSCPLTGDARAAAVRILDQSVRDSTWAAGNSFGHGVDGIRAFGAAVPFLSGHAGRLDTIGGFDPVVGFCAPEAEVEWCYGASPALPGVAVAQMWFQTLPMIVPSSTGETSVFAYESITSYEETGADGLSISWTRKLGFTYPGLPSLKEETSGSADNTPDDFPFSIDTRLDGLAPSPLTMHLTSDEAGVEGQASLDGVAVLVVSGMFSGGDKASSPNPDEHFDWVGPCAP